MSAYLFSVRLANHIQLVGPIMSRDDLDAQKRAETLAAKLTGAPQASTLLRVSKRPVDMSRE